MSFANWRARLAGKPIKTFLQPQLEDEGYYRKPITEPVVGTNGQRNGQKRIIGFEPVAYFIDDGMLRGVIGNRDMAVNEVTDEGLWSWVVKYPIKEEWFRAVAERGEKWPDFNEHGHWAPINLDDALKRSLSPVEKAIEEGARVVPNDIGAKATVESGDMQSGHNSNAAPPVAPHIEHSEAIDRAVGAAQDLKITDETSAAIVLGAINRIAELRLAADKAGKAIYQPLHKAYKAEQERWPPMIAKASAMEAKKNREYLKWRAAEKKKADDAECERLAEIVRIEEANARAADRAIGRGEPEPEPVYPEEVLPVPPPAPAPVAPTYRASGQRTKPKEVEKWWIDGIDDYAKVYEFFKDNAEVKAALLKAATAAITNGQEVPGTRRHFGLI